MAFGPGFPAAPTPPPALTELVLFPFFCLKLLWPRIAALPELTRALWLTPLYESKPLVSARFD